MTIASVAYRACLRLLPRRLRDDYGEEIEAAFAYDLGEARRRGVGSVLKVFLAAAFDVVSNAPRERWRRRDRHLNREQRMWFVFADLRYAFRSFARQPGATALILTTLSLAVAANVAVFTLLDGLFFRPFPFSDPGRLVYLNERAPSWNLQYVSINYPDFATWHERAHAFQSMAVWGETSVNLAAESGTPERVRGAQVSLDLPTVLGITPVLGRFFTPDEDRPKGPKVVAIGYALWQTQFAGSPDIVGKTLRINSAPYTIVGVLPPEAEFPNGVKLWLPLGEDPKATNQSYYLDGIARLKPGITVDAAARDLAEAHAPIWAARDSNRVVSPLVEPLRDRFAASYRTMGKALGAGVVLVLLIACANVAGAMLARSVFRRREIGIRIALGASTSRITRQLFTESLALATVAAAIGVLLGVWGLHAFVGLNTEIAPQWASLSVGPRTALFSTGIIMATAVLFGLWPAIQLRRQAVAGLASATTRVSTSRGDRRSLNTLVVAEIALATVLLAAGGLLGRGYNALRHVDPGFRTGGVAMFRLSLPEAKYKAGTPQMTFYQTLIAELTRLPGVDHAAIVTCPPFGCHWGAFFAAEGAPPLRKNDPDPVTLMRFASPDYFATMGIRFVRGRAYHEGEGSPSSNYRPVVVNEELARRLWPDVADPVGKRMASRGDTAPRWSTVIGVVRDVHHYGLSRPMIPGLYFPTSRIDTASNFGSFAVTLHTSGDLPSTMSEVRTLVRRLDAELPIVGLTTAQAAVDQSLGSARLLAFALAAFAAIALTLAVSGIYAVLSYVVGRRRHEIGIRMALGAQTSQVQRLVLVQGLQLVGIGMVLGIPLALVSARALSSLLVGVAAHDPITYAGVILVLGATGAIAALVPARRAASVDPKIALAEGGS